MSVNEKLLWHCNSDFLSEGFILVYYRLVENELRRVSEDSLFA